MAASVPKTEPEVAVWKEQTFQLVQAGAGAGGRERLRMLCTAAELVCVCSNYSLSSK